jgi:hypothetical protein
MENGRKKVKRPRASIYTETDASQSRKKSAPKKKNQFEYVGPVALSGVAGLRRVAASGMLGRMRNSGIAEMRIRETDAYRRLKVNQGGRALAREVAINREVARTGVGRSTGYGESVKRADLKRVRSWTPETFPQGEPSGKRPVPFRSPGNLAAANAAGKGAIKSGIPRTTPPAGRPSGGGGTGRGGSRVDGLRGGGGGGGEGGIFKKRIR